MLWEVSRQSLVYKIKSIFLSVLSGILSALPFCDGRLGIFAWWGFIPLFFALRNKTPAQAFLVSYLSGLIFWSITIYWLIHVTLLGQILLILYLALYFGIFGFIISYKPCLPARLTAPASRRGRGPASRRSRGKPWAGRHKLSTINLFFIPSLWVLLEYLRAHLLSGFGWAFLGYSQYLNLPLIQIADLFGAYGVSFLVMMGNVLIYIVVPALPAGRRRPCLAGRQASSVVRENKKYILGVFCLLVALVYGYYKIYGIRMTPASPAGREYGRHLKISLIQGNIPQELKWAAGSEGFILERYLGLTGQAAKDKPDLIIWPEAAVPGFWGEDNGVFNSILEQARETAVPLLAGSVVREKDKYFNSALLIDSRGKVSGRYDKLHLVPFGEYIPLKNTFKFLETIVPIGDFTAGKEDSLFQLSAIRSGAKRSLPEGGYPERSEAEPPRRGLSANFAVLICFEDTIPELSRRFVNKGADFLVNITNDGWFKDTSAPYQHLASSVFRAVENRVSLVRSANTGVSCFIDPRGRITGRLKENSRDTFVPGIKTGDIVISRTTCLYRRIGDIFVLACLALAGFCGIILYLTNHKRNLKP